MQQSAGNTLPKKEDVFAVLGGDPKPSKGNITVSKAFSLYLEKISYDNQYNKDADQLYSWKKTKKTSIDYFIVYFQILTILKIIRYGASDGTRTRGLRRDRPAL